MYKTQIITLLTWKLMAKDNWNLFMEENAHGFHNLVLNYTDDSIPGYMYRLVQIEPMAIANEITINTLLSTAKNEKDFNLIQLFEAYKAKIETITLADKIKDVIIFSKRSIKSDDLDFFEEMDRMDEIIGFDGWGKQYRINTHMIEDNLYMMTVLRKSCGDDQIIHNFLGSLVFVVKQPPVVAMEVLITLEIGKVFEVPEIVYSHLYKEINYWTNFKDTDNKAHLMKFYVHNYLEDAKTILLRAQK